MTSNPRLQSLDDNIWVADAPLRFWGFEIGTRMTTVRLSDGSLWLCSPIPIDEALAEQLHAQGPVRHVLGPNRYHHLYLGPACDRFDGARLYLAPGLAEKRADLAVATTLQSGDRYPWSEDLDHVFLEGVPELNEVAFFHRTSRTLILTDHLFHLGKDCRSWGTRCLGRMLGVYAAPALPREVRYLFVKNKAALAHAMSQVLQWDFDRVVLTHGKIVERRGKAVIEAAYADILNT